MPLVLFLFERQDYIITSGYKKKSKKLDKNEINKALKIMKLMKEK
jgi:hypothetical protein